MDKRQFILDTLLPYKQDPNTCGVEICSVTGHVNCRYQTPDNRQCAAGKHMTPEAREKHKDSSRSIQYLLGEYGQSIFTDEAAGQRLTSYQWNIIQHYHDNLARHVNKVNTSIPTKIEEINSYVNTLEKEFALQLPELKVDHDYFLNLNIKSND